ncbi:L-serine ammonia-lyase, iron-sulfur-dependent, subunit beta [Gemmiger qucibialis]|uniref:L-serine ammonia-lyase, iron-sulfur-dependent, subunit beta n=1 Tax=Gemmiger qucibialis TaxID=2997294 RepID=UPI003A521099
MAYSSVNAMLNVSRQNNQPLWDVILQSDLLESGLTRPQSLAEMHHLWQVMVQTSDNYCGADRSASGFAGGDAAKVAEAEARGQLLTGGYLAQVMAEALKTAECNACMKRIVAAPTAGSCGVLPAVLLPLWRSGSYNEEAICRALYVSAGFGQVVAARATLAGAEGGCQAEVGAASAWQPPPWWSCAAALPAHGSRRPGGAARRHRRTMRRSLCHGADQPGGPCV